MKSMNFLESAQLYRPCVIQVMQVGVWGFQKIKHFM